MLLTSLTVPLIRQQLRSQGLGFRKELHAAMLAASKDGGAIGRGQWADKILNQKGPGSQMFALLNGIIAVKGIEGMEKIELAKVTQTARDPKYGDTKSGDSNMYIVGEALRDLHHLNTIGQFPNPIEEITELFKGEKRFLAIRDDNGHAWTIVPVKYANNERFVLRLDPVTGEQRFLSLDDFLNLELKKTPDYYYCVYETVDEKPSKPWWHFW